MTRCLALFLAALLAMGLAPALHAQDTAAAQDEGMQVFDPDETFAQPGSSAGAIDADLIAGAPAPSDPAPQPRLDPIDPGETPQRAEGEGDTSPASFEEEYEFYAQEQRPADGTNDALRWNDPANGASVASAPAQTPTEPRTQANAADADTYGEDDLIGAAEGVFGRGAEGIARMIEDLLKKEGRPNGYIVGREAGGAFIFGARYGSGTLHHKIEGKRKVYWTGPSLGIDAGANAANTFVLVYNLFDTEDLFERFPAGEGQAYLVGGLHASYVRRGDIVLIPIRLGAGLRLGLNAGYLRFSKKQRWLPF